MKILIAEDNSAQQAVIGMIMTDWGYEFDIAPNGRRAVELAKINEGKYDICLMDIEMPVMSGVEATRLIRKKVKYFPIMGVSAESYLNERYSAIGMDDFLEKPYNPDELYDKINELTVKHLFCTFNGNKFFLKKEMPMDQQHAKELKELAKEGLCKMNIRGVGPHNLTVVTHKNIACKISRDFVENNQEVTVFLDRSKERPAECHLYKSTSNMPTIYLLEEEYEQKKAEEDEILKDCTSMVTQKKEG